jgi:hypothetical protein
VTDAVFVVPTLSVKASFVTSIGSGVGFAVGVGLGVGVGFGVAGTDVARSASGLVAAGPPEPHAAVMNAMNNAASVMPPDRRALSRPCMWWLLMMAPTQG